MIFKVINEKPVHRLSSKEILKHSYRNQYMYSNGNVLITVHIYLEIDSDRVLYLCMVEII